MATSNQAPDTLFLVGPNFGQVPASEILVTPTGGSQATLAEALSASGGLTPIPTLNFLGNAAGGSAVPVAVPLHPTMTVTGGALAMNLANANSWGASQTFNAATTFAANITGSTAGVWRTTTGSAASLGCFSSPSADHFRWGGSTNQIFALQPMAFTPNLTAFTGQTWGGTGSASIIHANTWTGTVVGGVSGFFPSMFINQTYNLAVGGGAAGPIKIIIQNGANFDGSLYAIDIQVSAVVNQSHAIGGDEFHSFRGSTQSSSNLGGTVSGSGLGILIGGKFATGSSAAATFLSIHNPMEITTANLGTTDFSYGALARDASTGTSFIDNAGLAVCRDASVTGSGYATGLLFGSSFYGPPVSTAGTLIGGTANGGGGAFTCANFIDMTNATFTGFVLKVGAATVLDGSLNLTVPSIGNGASALKISGSAQWSANGSVVTTLTGVGPTGSHTTVQEWLTVVDSAGTTRYIPAF